MTVTESKGLTIGNRVFWRGSSVDGGRITGTSWDAVTIAWDNGQAATVHHGDMREVTRSAYTPITVNGNHEKGLSTDWVTQRPPRSEAGGARGAASPHGARDHLWLHRQQPLALQFLARELAGAADGFRLLSDALLGGLLVMTAELHFAEYALTLHLLLQHLERLVDVVVTDENL